MCYIVKWNDSYNYGMVIRQLYRAWYKDGRGQHSLIRESVDISGLQVGLLVEELT